ncbi:MAG: hypothetical protein AAE985_05965 [Thermoplasmataceae archaeon]|jgi:hypothetical protein
MSIREILRRPLFIRVLSLSVILVILVSFFGIGVVPYHSSMKAIFNPNAVATNYNNPVSENQWSPITAAGPGPRANASMAYGSTTSGVILFGGETFNGPNTTFLNQTWQYYSGSWTNLTSSNAPPAMIGGSMQYDPSTGYILLFGGMNKTSYFSQTWIFTGKTWSVLNFSIHPSSRAFGAMSYSPALNAIILYGGIGPNGYLNSTWEYKNKWINITSESKKMPSMDGSEMAYDSAGYPIMFGGYNSSYSDSTWVMSSSLTWNQIRTINNPGSRAFGELKFYLLDNMTILFGGVNSNGPVQGTWEFNSSSNTWTSVQLRGAEPNVYFGQTMARYEANSTLILFGGSSGNQTYSTAYSFANITEYYVVFEESGLPSSTEWGVQLGSTFVNSTSSNIGILAPTGTQCFNITMVPSGYQTSQMTGNITVYFEELNETITFTKIPGLVYYFYGAFAGAGLVVLALIVTEVMRKMSKK